MVFKNVSKELPSLIDKKSVEEGIVDDKIVSNCLSDKKKRNIEYTSIDNIGNIRDTDDTKTIQGLRNEAVLMGKGKNEFTDEMGCFKRKGNSNEFSDENLLNVNNLDCIENNTYTSYNYLSPFSDHSYKFDEFHPKLRSKRNSIMTLKEKVIETSKDFGETFKNVAGKTVRHEVIKFGGTTSAHGLPLVSFNYFNKIINLSSFFKLKYFKINQIKEFIIKFIK